MAIFITGVSGCIGGVIKAQLVANGQLVRGLLSSTEKPGKSFKWVSPLFLTLLMMGRYDPGRLKLRRKLADLFMPTFLVSIAG